MKDFVVLFTSGEGVSTPRFFPCLAKNGDAAEALCEQAHPGCQVVWVAETSSSFAGYREYMSHGRLTPGQWVVWHDPDNGDCTHPAEVVRVNGEVVTLRGRSGSDIECLYTEIIPFHAAGSLPTLVD